MENTRAIALYRASTKQQTAKENNDIPAQKQIVREFVFKQGWTLVREFTEGGISGFKISANKRDALQTIKAMAVNGEFDVLVVYMSDRIGRIADETPLVISFLNKHGVKVISTTEGEIKTETHVDKLLTYIRYWQSEGESLKTRQRVTDYQIAAIEEGRFRGGSLLPYGYKLVDNGSKNYKGRHILDFVIDEEQAEVVKLIYKLSIEYNYGQSRIAQYLNEHGYPAPRGKTWYSSTIQSILNNPIYKGQLRYYSQLYDKMVLSPVQEHLIIIPPLEWEKNQLCMKARSYKPNSIVREDRRRKNTHGSLLFSGLIYCGHCGMALTTMTAYARWETKDGIKKKTVYHKYRCSSFYTKGAVKCTGQSTYGVSKIEPVLIKYIKMTIAKKEKEKMDENYIREMEQLIKEKTNHKKNVQAEIQKVETEITALEDTIAKTLAGLLNDFTPERLSKILKSKEEELVSKQKALENIEQEIQYLKVAKDQYEKIGFRFKDWAEQFDKSDFETKKAKINEVVDKIVVTKQEDGSLAFEITYNLFVEQFENMSCINTQDVLTNCAFLQPITFTEKYVSTS